MSKPSSNTGIREELVKALKEKGADGNRLTAALKTDKGKKLIEAIASLNDTKYNEFISGSLDADKILADALSGVHTSLAEVKLLPTDIQKAYEALGEEGFKKLGSYRDAEVEIFNKVQESAKSLAASSTRKNVIEDFLTTFGKDQPELFGEGSVDAWLESYKKAEEAAKGLGSEELVAADARKIAEEVAGKIESKLSPVMFESDHKAYYNQLQRFQDEAKELGSQIDKMASGKEKDFKKLLKKAGEAFKGFRDVEAEVDGVKASVGRKFVTEALLDGPAGSSEKLISDVKNIAAKFGTVEGEYVEHFKANFAESSNFADSVKKAGGKVADAAKEGAKEGGIVAFVKRNPIKTAVGAVAAGLVASMLLGGGKKEENYAAR